MIEQFEMAAKAAADTTRARILKMLEPGELCVCQITAVLDLAPATVSKHLSVLRTAGLVSQRRDGRWIHYRLADRSINPYAPKILALLGESLDDDSVIESDRTRLARVRELTIEEVCGAGVSLFDEGAFADS